MSLQSLQFHANPQTATLEDIANAIQKDLPLAYATFQQWMEEYTGERVIHVQDPNSDVGKQLIRVCAGDILRKAMQDHFGIGIGFLNCCNVIIADTIDAAEPTIAEQIQSQNGRIAYPDC